MICPHCGSKDRSVPEEELAAYDFKRREVQAKLKKQKLDSPQDDDVYVIDDPRTEKRPSKPTPTISPKTSPVVERQMFEAKNPKFPWWSLILIGLFFVGFSIWDLQAITELENYGGYHEVNIISYMVYQLVGKWGLFLFEFGVGALLLVAGVKQRQRKKRAEQYYTSRQRRS